MVLTIAMYFQDIIFFLEKFWCSRGCSIAQPVDTEVGAATSHYITLLKSLKREDMNIIYLQSCRRPSDGRFYSNSNRLQHYYQMQVLLKPAPINIQKECLYTLESLGINSFTYSITFVNSNWKNPTLGAWGIGWEIWCNGMEIVQFTYMQQLGGISCTSYPVEITYGLERLAINLQNIRSIWNILLNNRGFFYRTLFARHELEFCEFNFNKTDTNLIIYYFNICKKFAASLVRHRLLYPSYYYCLKSIHVFNILTASGALSAMEREYYIHEVRNIIKLCCLEYILC